MSSQQALFLLKRMVQQVGLIIEQESEEGLLIRTAQKPIMRMSIFTLPPSDLLFWIPEFDWLSFRTKREIPDWLAKFLEKRTKTKYAKWNLQELDGHFVYILEYKAKIRDLTPTSFEEICYSTMSEHASFVMWATTITASFGKSLKDLDLEEYR